jgi:hypothetical protein
MTANGSSGKIHLSIWSRVCCGRYHPIGSCVSSSRTRVRSEISQESLHYERIESLLAALNGILNESAGIREKRWWTHDEFNNPTVW